MRRYLQKVKDLATSFRNIDIQQVPRAKNFWTDIPSKLASSALTNLHKESFKILERSSIKEPTLTL